MVADDRVEPGHSQRGQISKGGEVDDPPQQSRDPPEQGVASVGQGRAQVRGPDGDERSDPTAEAELRDRVPRVETAHAVGDDVHARLGQGADQVGEALRAGGDGGGGRHTRAVHLRPELFEVHADPPEVEVLALAQLDLVEPQETVREHDGQPGLRGLARRPAPGLLPLLEREREKDRDRDRNQQPVEHALP